MHSPLRVVLFRYSRPRTAAQFELLHSLICLEKLVFIFTTLQVYSKVIQFKVMQNRLFTVNVRYRHLCVQNIRHDNITLFTCCVKRRLQE